VPRAKRGEIWIADLGLAAKVRPVLVLSVAYEGQERAIVSYVIRTTSLRGTQYEVRHETRGMPNGAFDAQGLGSIPEIMHVVVTMLRIGRGSFSSRLEIPD
jgi:mRNA interferase MazF